MTSWAEVRVVILARLFRITFPIGSGGEPGKRVLQFFEVPNRIHQRPGAVSANIERTRRTHAAPDPPQLYAPTATPPMRSQRKKRLAVLNSGTGPARRPTQLILPCSPKVSRSWLNGAPDIVDRQVHAAVR